jgi:hypothetical protein
VTGAPNAPAKPPLEAELHRLLGAVRERIALGDVVGAAGAIQEAQTLCAARLSEGTPSHSDGLAGLQRLLSGCVEDGVRARERLEQQLASSGAHTRAQLAYRRRSRPILRNGG